MVNCSVFRLDGPDRRSIITPGIVTPVQDVGLRVYDHDCSFAHKSPWLWSKIAEDRRFEWCLPTITTLIYQVPKRLFHIRADGISHHLRSKSLAVPVAMHRLSPLVNVGALPEMALRAGCGPVEEEAWHRAIPQSRLKQEGWLVSQFTKTHGHILNFWISITSILHCTPRSAGWDIHRKIWTLSSSIEQIWMSIHESKVNNSPL